MKQKFLEILQSLQNIVLRYPMVLVASLAAALSAATAVDLQADYTEVFPLIKLCLVACIGISLMFAVNMISKRFGYTRILELAAVAFLFGIYFYLPERDSDFVEYQGYILAVIFILSHLLVSFGPFSRRDPEISFWEYNKNLFINIFLTGTFTAVLVVGVLLAIVAVSQLFKLDFEETIYFKTFSFLGIFMSTVIFLLFCSRGLRSLVAKDSEYPQMLKFFTQFVLIPLLLIYVVILYFYSAQILFLWELPRGWVSYLILVYSVVGILALLLVHPLRGAAAKSWVKGFSKLFYYTLAPLLLLLFVAIYTRILAYGFTEPRYYVLLLALWLATIVGYFIYSKKGNIRFIPVSLFLFGIFGLFFPYFNALSSSIRSQKNELQKVFAGNELLENGKINFDRSISDSVADDIADRLNYLYTREEQQYVFSFLKKEQQDALYDGDIVHSRSVQHQIKQLFHNVKAPAAKRQDLEEIQSKIQVFPVSGYEYAVPLQTASVGIKIGDDEMRLYNDFYKTEPAIKLVLNGNESVDFYPALKNRLAQYSRHEIALPEISATHTVGNYEVKLFCAGASHHANGKVEIYPEKSMLLVRKRAKTITE